MTIQKEKLHIPEMWGGVECTINRVNNIYLDQFDLAGFYNHPEWIDDIIGLGIKALRFPVLWEKHQPQLDTKIDWHFTRQQLCKLKDHSVSPIVGLLHHGSGPDYTNLLDPRFPELFSGYALKVATEFPWVKYYTPVNEPLTTARFSGLYGYWYPHKKNDVSFIKMLLNQLKATVLAMQVVKKINPEACLVQTEDLGKTYSTALLCYQSAFENNRRWLTYDILCGKFDHNHSLWNYFMRLGIEEHVMFFFIENPCPPDVIGVNHYLTSERYLDDKIENYPGSYVGGNSLHHYIDIEAVRIRMREPYGIKILLQEIWQRYKIPIAITEVHLNCTREDQLRWLKEIYDIAITLNTEGLNILAVTAWSLLGLFGWDKLLMCERAQCIYETGAFDISKGRARCTALGVLIRNLSKGSVVNHPILRQSGWWKLDSRYFLKGKGHDQSCLQQSVQPIIIIGKTGTLGKAFLHSCRQRNLHHYLLDHNEADICNIQKIESMITYFNPWAIINASGFTSPAPAEQGQNLGYRINNLGTQNLAVLCEKYNVKLVTFSSDLVFDGTTCIPYHEEDEVNAQVAYGNNKELAEILCSQANPGALIIMTSAVFGPWDDRNFVYSILSGLKSSKLSPIAHDIKVSPTYAPHLVHATLDLLIDNENGVWRLTNKDCMSWYEFACLIAEKAGYPINIIKAGYNTKTIASQPGTSSITSRKYNLMPDLESAIEDYLLQKNEYLPNVTLT